MVTSQSQFKKKLDNGSVKKKNDFPVPGKKYKIRNLSCFLDNWGSSTQGQVVRLASVDNPPNSSKYSNQLWEIVPSKMEGYYKIKNVNCFLDNWGSSTQGQAVLLASVDNPPNSSMYSNQLWQIVPSKMEGYYKIKNVNCFLDNWSNSTQGQVVKLASVDNPPNSSWYSNQLWEFIPQ